LFACGEPSVALATGFYGPVQYLDNGGRNVDLSPEFFWELEIKRLSGRFHLPEKLRLVKIEESDGGPVAENPKSIATAEAEAKDFDLAIQINPKDSLAFNNRGLAYRNKGETDSAINNYDQAILISPDFALAYYNRGYAKSLQNKPSEAIENFDKAIELQKNDADAQSNRALSLCRRMALHRSGSSDSVTEHSMSSSTACGSV